MVVSCYLLQFTHAGCGCRVHCLTMAGHKARASSGTVVSKLQRSAGEIVALSPGRLAWRRLSRDWVAVACMIAIAVITVVTLSAPALCALLGVNPYDFHPELISDDGGLPAGALGGVSWAHPLGVEPLTGRDLMARLLYGGGVSLLIAVTATVLTVSIGVLAGIVAGYARGWLDASLSRLMDLTLAFPLLLVVIALSPVLQQRLVSLGVPDGNPARITGLVLVLSVFGWPYLARIIRGQVLTVRELDYITAAKCAGARFGRILFREILPNLWPPILIYTTLVLPSYVAAEAALAYLGISVQPPTPTWGAMLDDAVTYFTVDPFYFAVPLVALLAAVLSFNLLGDALRDALDPQHIR